MNTSGMTSCSGAVTRCTVAAGKAFTSTKPIIMLVRMSDRWAALAMPEASNTALKIRMNMSRGACTRRASTQRTHPNAPPTRRLAKTSSSGGPRAPNTPPSGAPAPRRDSSTTFAAAAANP